MGGYTVFVLGPAGVGKTYFCTQMLQMCKDARYVNLDPGIVEHPSNFADVKDRVVFDIREYVTTGEVMDELDYGPNGAFVVALQAFVDELENTETFGGLEDDILIFDCPGQIETYRDIERIAENMQKRGQSLLLLYLFDVFQLKDHRKLVYTLLCAMMTVSFFLFPFMLVGTKVDLVPENAEDLADHLQDLLREITENTATKEAKLLSKLADIVVSNGFSNVHFLDYSSEDALFMLKTNMDICADRDFG